MKKLLMVMVLGASAVAASAQGLQPRRTLGSRLARPAVSAAQKQQTRPARQEGAAKVAAKLGDGGQVPGLQMVQAASAKTNEVTVSYQVLDGAVVLGGGGLLRPRNERKTVALKIDSGALKIPDKVEGMIVRGIGYGAFARCGGLNSVMIPASVTNIANRAFSGRGGFTSILVDAANPLYSSRSGMLCSKDGTILIAGVNGDVKIPSCVTTIGENSFSGYRGLKSVTIPKGVVRIGRGAFRGCNGLETVTISSSVTSIGENAFDCSSSELRSFSVDPDNPLFCSRNGMLCNKDGTTLISGVNGDVTIPEGVTCIHDHAFSGRSELRSLKLPSTVTNIGVNAFFCCSGLKSVFIPKGVVCIRNYAFGGCSGLESVVISSSVMSIADDVFGGLGTLAPSRQSSSLGCSGIRSFSVDSDNPSYSSRNGLLCTKDGSALIAGVNGDVTIPEGVTSIGRCAFSCRDGLLSVEVPQSVKHIGESAFGGCSMLEAVTIPSSVTNIGSLAFARCDKLKAVGVVKDGRVESVAFDDFAKQHKLLTGEKAVQRRQLQMIQNELKRMREEKDVVQREKIFASPNRTCDKPAQGKIVVADKLQSCDFLLNQDFKKNAKFYLCLFSASWCGPCRREMPRIAKTYAETLKDDPDIELIHFSRDQNDEKALAWAKEHDVKFPVVKPNGGNPLDLHSRGIPHLFIVKADGTLVEEGHPMRIFNEEKFKELKLK